MIDNPIGIFDSGIGGLTVVSEIFKYLPRENIVYFGDTAHVPYGGKSNQAIKYFVHQNILFLLSHQVKIIVMACNTATAVALEEMQGNFKIPLVGVIEPGVKEAIKKTKNKKIGVIGTYRTILTKAYKEAIKKTAQNIKVYEKSCPLFVPLVEEGWFEKKVSYLIASEYLASLKKYKIDTLILGCTHYPLLKEVIQKTMGKKVTLINSAKEVAKEVYRILSEQRLLREKNQKASHQFFVNDLPVKFKKISQYFLGEKIKQIHLVNV